MCGQKGLAEAFLGVILSPLDARPILLSGQLMKAKWWLRRWPREKNAFGGAEKDSQETYAAI